MNANPTSRARRQFLWPVAGIVLAIALVAAVRPGSARRLTLSAGLAVWGAEMVLVAVLCARPAGARVAVLAAGLLLPLPAFVAASPLSRVMLACFMALPFAVATEFLRAPRAGGFGTRLAFMGSLGGRPARRRHMRGLDGGALGRLAAATAILAAAIAAAKAAGADSLSGLALRWLAGGVAMLALAEMVTAGLPLVGGALGVTPAPVFRSPHRATSLADFWARRWNLPASELFRKHCFGPLSRRGAGAGPALFATFALSALGHAALVDVALGRWAALACAAFFLAQPFALAAERRMAVRRWAPAAGRAWTLAVLAATSPLLVEPGLRIVEKVWGPPDRVLQPTAAVLGFVLLLSAVLSIASLAHASPAVAGAPDRPPAR